MKLTRTFTLVILALIGLTAAAQAGVILSPTAAIGNTFGDISTNRDLGNTFDQSGLSAVFVSGVTDFDTYIGGKPTHTLAAINNEWFAAALEIEFGIIDFDLGASYNITRLALWNEDAAGIDFLRVETSNDNMFNVVTSVGGFPVFDNPRDLDYPAEVLDLTDSSGRYVRLLIDSKFDFQTGLGPSMGEIAFEVGPRGETPEPSVAFLLGAGLSGLYFSRRRRS